MVDFADPDFARHPRFREAHGRTRRSAELEPGDLLFYPALWWHHVEALDAFNILVNYWWNDAPAFLDTPQTTLLHAHAEPARPPGRREGRLEGDV